jgi:PAS domain S-box-containing protein
MSSDPQNVQTDGGRSPVSERGLSRSVPGYLTAGIALLLAILLGVGWLCYRNMTAAIEAGAGENQSYVADIRSAIRWGVTGGVLGGIALLMMFALLRREFMRRRLVEIELRMQVAERRERERAEELAALLDAIPMPVFIARDPDCLTITGNRAAEELLRLPRRAETSLTAPEEAKPRHFRVLRDGRELRGEELPAQVAARGSSVSDFEETILFDDGTSRDMVAYATPLRDAAGNPRGSILVLVDITERKQAETALRRSEELLAYALDATTDGVWDWNIKSGAVTFSPQWLRLLGYSPEEVPHSVEFWKSIVHPDDMPCVWNALHQHFEGRAPIYECENRLRMKSGEYRWNLDRGKVVERDQEGRPVRMVGADSDISARKQTEAAVRESEARYRQLVQALPVAVYTCDAEGHVTLYNAAAANLWGREPQIETVRGGGAWRLLTAEGKRLPVAHSPIAMAMRQDEPIRDMELIVERPDGTRSNVLVFVDPTHDSSGAVTGAVNVLVDITALKLTENALRTSQRKLRTLARVVEQSPATVLITSPSGEIEYVNPKFTEVTGYSLEEVLGKNPRLLKSGLQPDGLYKELWETITARKDWRSELCNRKKNGELFWEFAVIAPIQDEHGTVTHFVAIKEDITERKRAEEALAESKHRLAGIVGSAMDAIISVDAGQRIVLFNAAAEKIFRCAASEAIGGSIERFIPMRFREAHAAHIRRFGETGVTSRAMGHIGALSGLRADGEEFPIDASISQVEVGGEKISTVILRDITERQRLEHDVLEISAHEQRRIGQDLHDDVCQWLTGTQFLASALATRLAARSDADAARAEKIADGVRQANARARALAHGLAPAMIEAAGLAGALRELAANAAEMFRIRCIFDGPETVKVRDEVAALHLYRIAQEAISNAVRHGGASEVHLLLQPDEDHVTMLIRDNGSGIAQPQPETLGMGLRTMHYRAGIVGARLEIRPGASGGTEIACTFPREL